MMRVFAFAALCSLALGQRVSAPTRTFGGYACRHECDVHAAGFGWAQARAIEDSRQCPQGISPSFHYAIRDELRPSVKPLRALKDRGSADDKEQQADDADLQG